MRKMSGISDLLGSEPEAFSIIRQVSGRGEEQSYQAGNSLHLYLWYLSERIGLLSGTNVANMMVLPFHQIAQGGDTQDSVALMLLSTGGGSRMELITRRNECLAYLSLPDLQLLESYCEVSDLESRAVHGDRAAITTLLNCLMLYNDALAVPR